MIDVADKIAAHTKTINSRIKQKGRSQGRLDAEIDNLKRLGFETEEDADTYVDEATKTWDKTNDELISDLEDFENEYDRFLS